MKKILKQAIETQISTGLDLLGNSPLLNMLSELSKQRLHVLSIQYTKDNLVWGKKIDSRTTTDNIKALRSNFNLINNLTLCFSSNLQNSIANFNQQKMFV